MEIIAPNQFETGYIFNAQEVREATTENYRDFLKEAGYVDLKETPNLFVAHKVLRVDEKVTKEAKRAEIEVYQDVRWCVNYTNQRNALYLIHNLGGSVLTSRLMYGLVIPHLKQSSGGEAKITLEEMTSSMAEFLADSILNKNTVKIGNAERPVNLPQQDGSFNSSDLNEFGYPVNLTHSGEFYYRFLRRNEIVVIRNGSSGLNLNCNRVPSYVNVDLGVRFAKFF